MLQTLLAAVAAVLVLVGLLDLLRIFELGNGVLLIIIGLVVAVVAYVVQGRRVL